MADPNTAIILHHIPGRTRLRLTDWPDAQALQNAERALDRSAIRMRANPYSRSILLQHQAELDGNMVASRLAAALESHAGGKAPDRPASDAPDGSSLEAFAALAPEAALARMDSSERGLSEEEAAARLAVCGPNSIAPPRGRSPEEMLRGQLATFPMALLAGSAVLSVMTGGLADALVTLGVIAANAAIGFSSENATERLIRRLSQPVEHEAEVQRDGARRTIPAHEVVPGDLFVLRPESVVPADARIIRADALSIDESMLTGESLPVEKTADAIEQPMSSVAERHNLLHAGTVVTGGGGLALALRTGSDTEMARTRAMIGQARPPRPEVEVQLEQLARKLGYACLGASGLVLAIGLARGEALLAMVRSAIALTVAAVPEGLPAVATTTLALTARAMERERAYIRALPAIEALGGIDTICLDKTGTLTENHMQVRMVAIGDNPVERPTDGGWNATSSEDLRSLAEAAALCNEASLAEGTGSSTERALLHLAEELGLDPDRLQKSEPIRKVYNRNDLRHWMATQHEHRTIIKGAPDEVLSFANEERFGGKPRSIGKARRKAIMAVNAELARRGLRVLGIAQKEGALAERDGRLEQPSGFTWLGLVAMADPLRSEAAEAIECFHRAGIRTVMITGDQAATALAIAEELALSGDESVAVVEGAALAELDAQGVGDLAAKSSVFARASPADKLRIVEGLQAAGRRVAMIGDGVNDGPALRASTVGVAMGRKGTDVAREIADLVIADDDLRALGRAIARARGAGENVRNATRYFLSTNLSEMIVMLGEILHGPGEMETPMELFWLNLVSDVLPGLGLGLAEPRGDVLDHKPRPAGAPLFDRGEIREIATDGLAISAAALTAHFLAMRRNPPGPATRAATFLTLASAQIAHGWTLRDRAAADRTARRISERRLAASLAGSSALLALPLLLPSLRGMMGIARPGPGTVLSSLLLAGMCFGFGEGRRIIAPSSAAAGPARA